jgi:hypothetical protein
VQFLSKSPCITPAFDLKNRISAAPLLLLVLYFILPNSCSTYKKTSSICLTHFYLHLLFIQVLIAWASFIYSLYSYLLSMLSDSLNNLIYWFILRCTFHSSLSNTAPHNKKANNCVLIRIICHNRHWTPTEQSHLIREPFETSDCNFKRRLKSHSDAI